MIINKKNEELLLEYEEHYKKGCNLQYPWFALDEHIAGTDYRTVDPNEESRLETEIENALWMDLDPKKDVRVFVARQGLLDYKIREAIAKVVMDEIGVDIKLKQIEESEANNG